MEETEQDDWMSSGTAAREAGEQRMAKQDNGRSEAQDEAEIRERLRAWRQAHPLATFDEIDAAVAQAYAALHAEVVAELSGAATAQQAAVGRNRPTCPQCQSALQRCGQRTRAVRTRRGVAVEVQRDYYVCPACGVGVFPPR